MSRPPLEVADIVHQHGDAFLERYGHILSGVQHKALRAIVLCRTVHLGGHKSQCERCGHQEMAYNSCRNRHCPKYHGAAQAAWLAARQREVLDVPYVHVVFTLPHLLSPLTLQNPRLLYDCLFRKCLYKNIFMHYHGGGHNDILRPISIYGDGFTSLPAPGGTQHACDSYTSSATRRSICSNGFINRVIIIV